MRSDRKSASEVRLNNQGFTLVELIISIAILVIIMVPLMGNFIRSIQMNSKAKKLQIQSNLASSIMEGLKSYNIDEVISKFNGQRDDFDIISNTLADVMRLEEDGTGGYVETSSNTKQSAYYFAINGIQAGSSSYDAFITMEANPYQIDDAGGAGIMNNYPMPKVINMDEKANGLLYSEGSPDSGMADENVLDTFISWGRIYAQTELNNSSEYQDYLIDLADYRSREVEGELLPGELPPPEPALTSLPSSLSYLSVFFTPEEVRKIITKTMTITANNDIITYDITYFCNWPSGGIESTITHEVSDVQYPIDINSIYIFYRPSVFSLSRSSTEDPADRIYISNEAADAVDFYVALQEDMSGFSWDSWYNKVEISATGAVILYTDIPAVHYNTAGTIGTAIPELITSEASDRIFAVTVNICMYVNDPNPNNRYKNILYTLHSSAED